MICYSVVWIVAEDADGVSDSLKRRSDKATPQDHSAIVPLYSVTITAITTIMANFYINGLWAGLQKHMHKLHNNQTHTR